MPPKTTNLSTSPRDYIWSSSEIDILIDEYIKRKDYLEGSFSSSVNNKGKKRRWEEIVTVLRNAFPSQVARTSKQVRKKIDNLKDLTNKEVRKMKDSISGTRGGPQYVMKPIYDRIDVHIIGVNSPAGPGNMIKGSVESENTVAMLPPQRRATAAETSSRFNNPSSSTYNVNRNNVHYLSVNEGHVDPDEVDCNAKPMLDEYLQQSTGNTASDEENENTEAPLPPLPTPGTSCGITPSRGTHNGRIRDTLNKTKRSLANFSEESCRKRLLKDRLDIAHALILVRASLGNPITVEELPEDIATLISNPKEF